MSNNKIERIVGQIREKLPKYGSVERAAEEVVADCEVLMGEVPANLLASISQAKEIVRSSLEEVEILRPSSIIKESDDWYRGPQSYDKHWPALDGYLRHVKNWDDGAVNSIDETSSEVVSLLGNPAGKSFCCRGLVVGYVQSGKTANMTAVIAKAVDAGYNLVVVLGGMTNKLRSQTQFRLNNDIIDRHRELWQLYTEPGNEGDFVVPKNGAFTMPVPGRAQLAVLKKVSSRLSQFLKTIKSTQPAILRELKVLIIDDECDQASVNSARGEYDMTTINKLIRQIIRSLPAVSYVGYTATPFANVFINPYPAGKETLDDLYPEDFITALPKPDAYFGTREVFGDEPEDPGEEIESGHDVIRLIEDKEELDKLRPERAADTADFQPAITKNLEQAILWFIGSCAVRRRRGHAGRHMSMLVHTSPRILQHDRMADAIDGWLNRHADELRACAGPAFQKLSCVMDHEYKRVEPYREQHEVRPPAAELVTELNEVIDALEVVVENGESERRIDYNSGCKTYIVVGGNVLARGLTLEGLCVSFFLRTSSQYDSLLQMGRWFGYRQGYEDLPRLWTTPDLSDSFRQLARIEEEIREDIQSYRTYDMTPASLAVKVRAIPGMAITSAGKMRHAYRTSISFAGRHVQTVRFDHRNDDVVRGNWKAACRLIDTIESSKFAGTTSLLATDVDIDKVRRFLKDYAICDSHLNLSKNLLLEYIDKQRDHLLTWNVGIVMAEKGQLSRHDLGGLGRVRTVNRSRLSEPKRHYADIKALMSRRDVLLDALEQPAYTDGKRWEDLKKLRPAGRPLLLLYPIDAASSPNPHRKGELSKTRQPLDAVDDLVGMAIIFPGERDTGGNYYSVELDVPALEDLDDEDILEAADDMDGAELISE